MLLAAPLLALLTGCQPATPTDAAASDVAEAPAKADKNGKKDAKKGKKTAKAGKSNGAKTAEAPLGVAGPVTGTLALVEVPPPPAADGAAGTTTTKKTEAKLAMTFSDGQSSDISLGTMEGDCTEITPVPIGEENKTPLWSVRCVKAEGTATDLHIVQNDDVVAVLKKVEAEGKPVTYKPMKRVKLAEGAALTKGSSG
jgi:hypothetical protein